ncbi:phage major capsid protein [uncultured Ruminococcus sp.]|uniref:phage major capsid protein n=1 Tax=uncultured Ruminococcus sp. TaxID=165186 RepID=UPI0025FA1DD5|nr:phage major capsid protein [uncultured Ruminococcus sp.]
MAGENTIQRGTLLEPETVTEIFSKVKGHSTLAKLCGQTPVSFNGNDYFTFSMDDEAAVVGESEKKTAGKAALGKVTMRPVKIEYGARFSDEFIYGTDEKKLEVIKAFAEGAAVKFARAIDILGFHGLNPRTKTVVAALDKNYIDKAVADNSASVTFTEADPESGLEDAVAMLGDYECTGFAFSREFAAAMAKLKVNGVKQYPEFALGANPGSLNGTACDVNSTISFNDNGDAAIVGDFVKAFKWGYAKSLPLEVIRYGDPDNTGRDLAGHNEVYLRTEAYIGFAVLDPKAFAAVKKGEG